MRALIRDNEIYTEDRWSPFTINHIEWHRTANPDGDGYALAENAPADAVAGDFDVSTEVRTITDETGQERTVTLLTATLNADRYNARRAQEAAE